VPDDGIHVKHNDMASSRGSLLLAISAVLVPVASAILVPLIVFWYLRTPGVKAFLAR